MDLLTDQPARLAAWRATCRAPPYRTCADLARTFADATRWIGF